MHDSGGVNYKLYPFHHVVFFAPCLCGFHCPMKHKLESTFITLEIILLSGKSGGMVENDGCWKALRRGGRPHDRD